MSKHSCQRLLRSVTEVEVVISVVVIFSLTEARANKVESNWEPRNSKPNAQAVINNYSVNEEALEATEHKVEQKLLSSVRAMVPDVASCISTLLIKVFLAIPCTVLHLWYSKTFTIGESHVLHVSEFVVCKSTS